MSNRKSVLLGVCLWLGIGAITWAESPPVAPVRPVVEDYFGTKLADPYRYMENLKDPEVQAWIKGQADCTAALLAKIPGFRVTNIPTSAADSATLNGAGRNVM